MKSITLVAALLFGSQTALASEWTEAKEISRIQMAEGGVLYFFSTGPWGAPGCPNASYVYTQAVPGWQQYLSLVLAAKIAKLSVKFRGTCVNDNYFNLDYIIVE